MRDVVMAMERHHDKDGFVVTISKEKGKHKASEVYFISDQELSHAITSPTYTEDGMPTNPLKLEILMRFTGEWVKNGFPLGDGEEWENTRKWFLQGQ